MNVGELVAKLQQVDPTTLVCGEDGELGLHADITAYEITAYVDRSGSDPDPFVDKYPARGLAGTEANERVVVLSRWGQDYDGPGRAREL